MKRVHLFTKEDIERFGFIYEPDVTKCQTGHIKVFYAGFCQRNGKIFPDMKEWGPEFWKGSEEEYKNQIAEFIYLKYLNDVFVVEPEVIEGMDNFHGDAWVMISGHTRMMSAGEKKFLEENQNTQTQKENI